MATQNQTTNSQTQQPGGKSTPGQDDVERGSGPKRGQKGQDAGNVARSVDDEIQDGSEGTREDAAGTQPRSSGSDPNETN